MSDLRPQDICKSTLKAKDICNCDQALSYRKALETINKMVYTRDPKSPLLELEKIGFVVDAALDHPEAE